jgi:hypothetical protein
MSKLQRLMELPFTTLYDSVSDEKVRRWLLSQIPEISRLRGEESDFMIDSLRLRYDPDEEV